MRLVCSQSSVLSAFIWNWEIKPSLLPGTSPAQKWGWGREETKEATWGTRALRKGRQADGYPRAPGTVGEQSQLNELWEAGEG